FYDPATNGIVAGGRDLVPHSDSDWGVGSSGLLYNQWNHLTWLVSAGSGNGNADGSIILYLNSGGPNYSHINVPTLSSGFTSWTEFYIGNYTRSGDWGGTTFAYWESVYIDKSWARVEVGDNANYNSCTHREILIPSAWSD